MVSKLKASSLFIFGAVFGFGTANFAGGPASSPTPSRPAILTHASSAAFRDGLHLGRWDRNQGRSEHLAIGRWHSSSDRNLFTSGYEVGFQQAPKE
jgi:hypothetical protein